jgi:hypothetical protein
MEPRSPRVLLGPRSDLSARQLRRETVANRRAVANSARVLDPTTPPVGVVTKYRGLRRRVLRGPRQLLEKFDLYAGGAIDSAGHVPAHSPQSNTNDGLGCGEEVKYGSKPEIVLAGLRKNTRWSPPPATG